MLFWSKDRTKIIHDELDSISKSVRKLKSLEEKKDKSLKIIKRSMDAIADAKDDMLKRADEKKGECLIDWRYDSEIDRLARQEIAQLEKLRENLKYYEKEVLSAAKSEDFEVVLEFIEKEVREIEARDSQNVKTIADLENRTVTERLRQKSSIPSVHRTSDNFRWVDIAQIVRQLGGWIVPEGGNHPDEIIFPNASRPIPISKDMSSHRVASEIKEQLNRFMPAHKIPNNHELRNAFRKGRFT